MENDRIQEIFLLIGDRVSLVGKRWWLALLVSLLAMIPVYYLLKLGFVALDMRHFQAPALNSVNTAVTPLDLVDYGFFDLGNSNYSVYIRINNIEHDWGVPKQEYTAEFFTYGGTALGKVNGSTYILPSSEKLVVLTKFHSDTKPDQMKVNLAATHFVRKPSSSYALQTQRVVSQNQNGKLVVSAAVKNLTPLTIRQVDLPVAVFDAQNKISAVNYTYINDLQSHETRTFQYPPMNLSSGRAEILPSINIYDPSIFETIGGISPVDQSQ